MLGMQVSIDNQDVQGSLCRQDESMMTLREEVDGRKLSLSELRAIDIILISILNSNNIIMLYIDYIRKYVSRTLLLIIVNMYNWQMIRNVFVLYLIQSWYIFDVQMKCDGPNVALTPLS